MVAKSCDNNLLQQMLNCTHREAAQVTLEIPRLSLVGPESPHHNLVCMYSWISSSYDYTKYSDTVVTLAKRKRRIDSKHIKGDARLGLFKSDIAIRQHDRRIQCRAQYDFLLWQCLLSLQLDPPAHHSSRPSTTSANDLTQSRRTRSYKRFVSSEYSNNAL